MKYPEYPVIDLLATGQRIHDNRIAAGYKVKDVMKYMGFRSPRTIYKWQKGECLPTVDNLVALSLLFNVSMDSIIVLKSDG